MLACIAVYSRKTGPTNPAGFSSLKLMYYIHAIMIIKRFLTWLDLTWILSHTLLDVWSLILWFKLIPVSKRGLGLTHWVLVTHICEYFTVLSICTTTYNFVAVAETCQLMFYVNLYSLWHSVAIWRHRSGLRLARVTACCLTAPSHYLNQCLLIITEMLWYFHEGNFRKKCLDIYPWY